MRLGIYVSDTLPIGSSQLWLPDVHQNTFQSDRPQTTLPLQVPIANILPYCFGPGLVTALLQLVLGSCIVPVSPQHPATSLHTKDPLVNKTPPELPYFGHPTCFPWQPWIHQDSANFRITFPSCSHFQPYYLHFWLISYWTRFVTLWLNSGGKTAFLSYLSREWKDYISSQLSFPIYRTYHRNNNKPCFSSLSLC